MTKATANILAKDNPPQRKDREHTLGFKGVQSLALGSIRTIQSAINEWIDNSRDADAEIVEITITKTSKHSYVKEIITRDNGHGMDFDELFGAFEIGHDRYYKSNSIGKFGLGGTMSSLSLFHNKVVLTKTLGGQILGRAYDMKHVEQAGKWTTFQLSWAQIHDHYPEHVEYLDNLSHGTVVINYNPTSNKAFKTAVDGTISQIGETFSSDLKSGYFNVTVNDTKVVSRCALGSDKDEAIVKTAQDIVVKGRNVGKVTCISLRDAKLKKLKGHVLQQQAGFYFTRADRLITKAIWPGDSSGMFPANGNFSRGTLHPDNRFVRIKVEFDPTEDEIFGVRSSKDAVLLDQSLADVISSLTTEFVSQDASVVLGRSKKKSAETFQDSASSTIEKVKLCKHAAPKKKLHAHNVKPSTTLSVAKREPAHKSDVARGEWLSGGIEMSDLGFETGLSVYVQESDVLKFNKQHPSLNRITDLSAESQKVLTEIFVSLHAARIETSNRLEDFCETTMSQFFQTLDQKFRAIVKD